MRQSREPPVTLRNPEALKSERAEKALVDFYLRIVERTLEESGLTTDDKIAVIENLLEFWKKP